MRISLVGTSGNLNGEILMKNKLTIISRLGTISLLLGLLCFSGTAMAQEYPKPMQGEMPKQGTASTGTPAASKSNTTNAKAGGALSAQDKAFVEKAAKGGNMEV